MPRIFCKPLILAAFLTILGGCGQKDLDLVDSDEDARELYQKASQAMHSARLQQAIRYFQALEARYPFSAYALQAQLDLAYSYFRFDRPEKAVSEAERFIRFNPTHPHVDYAYYIKALSAYKVGSGFLEGWFPRNPADRNQQPLQDAFNDFAILLRKFPGSRYAADARQRMIHLKNELAEHELHVAQYYLRRKAWVAAANRANYLLQHFEDTPYNQEALAILVQSYRELGLKEPEKDARKVLATNFPGHPLIKTAE